MVVVTHEKLMEPVHEKQEDTVSPLCFDNDCNAATVGSIAGAIAGAKGIAEHWTRPFNNKVRSYFHGYPDFQIDDLIKRFTIQARNSFR